MKNRFTKLCSLILSTAMCFTTILDAGFAMTNVYAEDAISIVDDVVEEYVALDDIQTAVSAGDLTPVSPNEVEVPSDAYIAVDGSSLVINGNDFDVDFEVVASTSRDCIENNYIILLNGEPLATEPTVIVGEEEETDSVSFNSYPVSIKGTSTKNGLLTLGYMLKHLDAARTDDETICEAGISIIVDSTTVKVEDFPANTVENDLGLTVTFGGKDVAKGLVKTQGNYYYTGKPIKPFISVYDGNVELVNGKDYKLKYKNNKNALSSNDLSEKFGSGWVYNGFLDKFNAYSKQPQIEITGAGAYKGVKLVKFFNIIPIDYDEDKYIYIKPVIENKIIAKKSKAQKPGLELGIYEDDTCKSTLKRGVTGDYILNYTPVSANILGDGEVEYIKLSEAKDSIPANGTGLYMLTVKPTRNGKQKITGEAYDAGVVTVMDTSKNLTNAKVEFDKKSYKYEDMEPAKVSENSAYNDGERFAYWELPSDMVKVYMNGTEMHSKDYTIVTEANAGANKDVYLMLTPSGQERYNYLGMAEGKPCKVKSKLNVVGTDIKNVVVSVKTTRGESTAASKVINIPYDGGFAKTVDDYADKIIVEDGTKVLSGNGIEYKVKILKSCKLPVGVSTIRISGCGEYSGSLEYTLNVSTGEIGAKSVSVNDIIKIRQMGDSETLVDIDEDNEAVLNSLVYSKNLKPQISLVTLEEKELKDKSKVTVYKDLTSKDYKVKLEYADKKSKVGNVLAKITFKGIYKNIPTVTVRFDVLPQTDSNLIWSSTAFVNYPYEEIDREQFIKKATSAIKLVDKNSGKSLSKKDYVISENAIYDIYGREVDDDFIIYDSMYYIAIQGCGNYEGLSKFVPACIVQKGQGFKPIMSDVVIAYKGDTSYFDRSDLIEVIDEDIDVKGVVIMPIAGKGNYNIAKQKWEFDANYYGTPGIKSVNLYVNSGDYVGVYIPAKIRVTAKDKEVSTYSYIRSIIGL